jgi:nondiscriminating glutamyl-tRNA synthetase
MKQAGYMTGEETGEKLEWLKKVILTARTQAEYGAEIPTHVALYFNDEFDFETPEAKAVLAEPTVPLVMKEFLSQLKAVPTLDGPTVKGIFKGIQKGNKLNGKQVYMPVRVALTGNQHGPELVEIIPLLGKERTEKRIMASLTKAGVNLEGK